MKNIVTIGLTIGLTALCSVCGRAETAYFEDVRTLKDLATSFHLTVGQVFEDSPAQRAGLRPGDRIVGVDGARVRTPAEYMFMRYYYDTRQRLDLTVLRGAQKMDVCITDAKPIRRGGFYWRNPYDRYYELLLDWNLPFDGGRRVFQSLTETKKDEQDTVSELFDVFGVKEPRIITQTGRLLALFPARGWEEIARLMKGADSGKRRWVEAMLNTYLHLRFGEREQAARTIGRAQLVERAPTPFLGDLAEFYMRVCESPPDWGTSKIWERYGTSLGFFVICYPYPVRVEGELTKHFAFDPEFQDLFDRATAGIWVDRGAIGARAMHYANSVPESNPVERYVGQIKASLLAHKEHGGWPYRSVLVQTQDQRTKILAAMSDRLRERPEERVLTAFVMLCPALMNNDFHHFKRVYPILFNAGARERGSANAMVGNALRRWTRREKYRAVIAAFEEKEKKPGFLEYMIKVGPAFRYKTRLGSYYRHDHGVVGLESWTAGRLHDVARALVAPLDVSTLDKLIGAEDAGGAAAGREAFVMLTRELAGCPSQERMDQFVALAGRMPVGEVMDAACRVFGYHNSESSGGHIRVNALFTECFAAADMKQYERVAAELETDAPEGGKIVELAARVFKRSGTPAVCLLLSRRLRLSGRKEAAKLYERKAVNFYENLTSAYSGYRYRHLHRHAYRDMISVRGFHSEAAEHRERSMIRARDSDYVLSAVDDFYTGAVDDAVANLVSSVGPEVRKGKGTYLFHGKVQRSVAALRRALICRMVISLDLSGKQMAALAGLKGVDMDAVIGALRREDGVQRDAPVRFAVDLASGETVVGVPEIKGVPVKTSYANIRLPLKKIQSISFRDTRRMADVRLRNGDTVNGVVELGTVAVKTSSGRAEIAGKDIRMISVHTSRVDRFRACVTRAKNAG